MCCLQLRRFCVTLYRELSLSFSRLCHYVDLTKTDLEHELCPAGREREGRGEVCCLQLRRCLCDVV